MNYLRKNSQFRKLAWSTQQASSMHLRHKTSLMTESVMSTTPLSFWICITYYFGQSCGLKYLSCHKCRINLDGKDFNNLRIVLVLGEIFLIENTFWYFGYTLLLTYTTTILWSRKLLKESSRLFNLVDLLLDGSQAHYCRSFMILSKMAPSLIKILLMIPTS